MKPLKPLKVKLPFVPWYVEQEKKILKTLEDAARKDFEEREREWVMSVKKTAIANINNEIERMRISWVHKFKIPKYRHHDNYTLEEMLLESWEQFYFENPDHLETKGIFKKKDSKTGYSYYETGDPLIDQLEKEFASGQIPDLDKAFGHIKDGVRITKALFGDREPVSALKEQMQKDNNGEKIDLAGPRIQVDDYKSDDWLKSALNEDPVLKAMEAKLKGVTDANI